MTNFTYVSEMNEAFGNPQGDPKNIDWPKVRRQCLSILDEFIELQKALGLREEDTLTALASARSLLTVAKYELPELNQVRDGLCDIHVFGYGAHHLMGIDADRDMVEVVDKVMTRFIKDEADEAATIAKHAAKGVTEVYLEGEYPRRILKSAAEQPDAPVGKFLKSASFQEPEFYEV